MTRTQTFNELLDAGIDQYEARKILTQADTLKGETTSWQTRKGIVKVKNKGGTYTMKIKQ